MGPADQKLLKEILEAGRRLETLWSDPGTAESLEELAYLKRLIELAQDSDAHDLARLAFHARDLAPQMTARHLAAILVPFERLNGRSLRDDEFMVTSKDAGADRVRDVAPLTVIADNLRSAFNVGAIFRTAEAFGAERVILTGYTPTPDDEKTARTSLGAAESIAWETEPKVKRAIQNLRADGYQIVALETSQSAIDLEDFEWPEKTALLLGNERFGHDVEVLKQADHLVRIPMYGRKNSLNVGIAFGIAAQAWREQRECSQERPSRAIGVFRSGARFPYEARRQGADDTSGDIGMIELAPGQQFEQALEGLEGFERIWILYRFHHNTHWKPKVLPPRGPRVKQGVFATRSPYRPNQIGMSAVELVRIDGRKIFVRSHDLLDGTPILDLKPYLPYADAFPAARMGWVEGLESEAFQVRFAERAETQLFWLEANGVSQLRGFLAGQLEFDPLDDSRKRVSRLENGRYRLAYRTWRADFEFDESARVITVQSIASGYSDLDLEAHADPYSDKGLHREFRGRTW